MVVRMSASGDLCESSPCSHCRSVIRSLGIRRVVYSDEKGDLVTLPVQDMDDGEPSTGYRHFREEVAMAS